MAIYDIDYSAFVPNILPPNKRLPRFMQLLRDYVIPLQWNRDNFFIEYADGSGSPLWSSTNTYAAGNRVISWYPFDTHITNITNSSFTAGQPRSNSVFECQVSGVWPTLCAPQQDNGTGAELTSSLTGAGAVGTIGIKNGGTGYGTGAWVFFVGGGGTGSLAVANYDDNLITATATLTAGAVSSIALAVSSKQPTSYVVPPQVIILSFTGTGAKAVPQLTDGIVTGFTIVAGGSGYVSPPSVIVFGGTTRGAGRITDVNVISGGSGYTEPPQILMGSQWEQVSTDFRGARQRSAYNGSVGTLTWILNEWFHTTFRNFSSLTPWPGLYGWGSGNSAFAHATWIPGGAVTTVVVDSPGTGYSVTPTVFISDPTGTGAVAYAVMLDGKVSSINVVAGGSGYTNPTVTLFGGGTGPFQQAHSDIFINTLSEVGNIFFVGAFEAESSYVVNDESEATIPFLQYVMGDNGESLFDFVIWVPQAYWDNIVVPDPLIVDVDQARADVFRRVANEYVIAGMNYKVLPY